MQTFKKQPDKIYSTYWWIIILDPTHPDNSPDIYEFTGYSKMSGHDEAKDKAELLMKKIIMLHSQGYFEKGKRITIFMKKGDLLNKANSRALLTLNRKDYTIDPECAADKAFFKDFLLDRGVLRFLKQFYDCIANGKTVQYLLPKSKASFSKDDYLDVEKQHFNSEKQLDTYCERIYRNGHPFEAVMNFRRKYIERKPFS